MKRIRKILFGEVAKGEPLNYNASVHTVMPYNITYAAWKEAIKEFGYQDVIRFLQRNKDFKPARKG